MKERKRRKKERKKGLPRQALKNLFNYMNTDLIFGGLIYFLFILQEVYLDFHDHFHHYFLECPTSFTLVGKWLSGIALKCLISTEFLSLGV
jgi:hypothetical protein